MGGSQAESAQQVTPLELLFDLVVVSAIAQVTTFLSHSPTWGDLLLALLLLGMLSIIGQRTYGYASARASEVDRSRKAFACSCRPLAFCSAMAMASAPATKRRGGCSWLAIVIRARAS